MTAIGIRVFDDWEFKGYEILFAHIILKYGGGANQSWDGQGYGDYGRDGPRYN